jgi:ketosteroid isomerase-like protein
LLAPPTLLAAALLAAPASAPPRSVAPVVEAERAFAAMARDKGTGEAFKAFIAEDGQMFLPGPVRARPLLEAGRIGLGTIRWWPVYAGLAASGDLGFTTGPFVAGERADLRHGTYFTVWRRQADGRWRWVLDCGSLQETPPPQGRDTPIEALPTRAGTAKGAWNGVAVAEAKLAAALAADARTAMRAVLGPDARLLRNGPAPAVGRTAIAALLAAGPKRVAAAPLGGAVSAAGDLAYTYGTAAWIYSSGVRRGWYVRIWQRRARGWTLVVDETVAPHGDSHRSQGAPASSPPPGDR